MRNKPNKRSDGWSSKLELAFFLLLLLTEMANERKPSLLLLLIQQLLILNDGLGKFIHTSYQTVS